MDFSLPNLQSYLRSHKPGDYWYHEQLQIVLQVQENHLILVIAENEMDRNKWFQFVYQIEKLGYNVSLENAKWISQEEFDEMISVINKNAIDKNKAIVDYGKELLQMIFYNENKLKAI